LESKPMFVKCQLEIGISLVERVGKPVSLVILLITQQQHHYSG